MKKLKRLLRFDIPLHFVLLLTNWLPDIVVFLRLRGYLSSFFLGECGTDLRLGRNITFYNPQNIRIGNNVYLAYGVWFSANETITLGDTVIVGPNCIFSSGNHTKVNGSFRYGKLEAKPIVVKSGTWIGAQSCILSGVVIGKGALVAANSVVIKNIANNTMVAGIPTKVIKDV